jgi:predicted double-glycine peptidase
MGWDLMTALVVITTLSVLAYLAGKNLGRGVCRARSLLFAESLILSLVFAWCMAGGLFWARAVPGSGVVYWSNLMPVLLSFAAGLAIATPGLDRWRRPLTVSILGSMAGLHLLMPIARPLVSPAGLVDSGHWAGPICLQSHEATCGAAAAATLLNLKGIAATEQEMIDFCLTSSHGTEPLGLYRGLKLASRPFGADAAIASPDPGQWIARNQLPNVALIWFADAPRSGPIRRLLGPRGEGHAIVVLGFKDGDWILGDPAIGQVRWSDTDFRRRFTGDAIYLTGR